MPIKIDISDNLQTLFDSSSRKNVIGQVRKEFAKTGPKKFKQGMIQDMIKGISPVKGVRKWKKYSDSYKSTIRGKKTFRVIGGKVVPMDKPDEEFRQKAVSSKSISPVNLRLSGKLHRSLKVFTGGGVLRNFRMIVKFNNFLADIHNRLGAGKPKVVRRLLPTNNGETFNRRLTSILLTELKKAADKVAQQISRQ